MNTPLSNQGQGKGPCLLVIEDDDVLNQLLTRELRKAGYEVRSVHTWAQARQCMIGYSPELVLLDMQLPDSSGLEPLSELATTQPVVMLTAYGDVHQAVQAMRLGAADYLVKPVDLDELELVIRRALEKSELQKQKECLVGTRGTQHATPMVGTSAAMQRLREQIAEVAASDVTVLIQGESGTGKELVAQAIHAQSPRNSEAFVPVDCCTLQEALFESELFGHERGAFTGADRRKPGLIEAAAHGTLFLDEMGEAGPAIQSKLLRVIETGRFRRVGSSSDQRADVRIVAATNRDLLSRSIQGAFRQDLYYRLSTFVIDVPPLRNRTEDIPFLTAHFLTRRCQSQGTPIKRVSPEALSRLCDYKWPGNVRELRNVIERAFIVAGADTLIDTRHLSLQTPNPAVNAGVGKPLEPSNEESAFLVQGEPTLDEIERSYIHQLLVKYHGNRRRVADALGVSERTAYRMLERHGFK
jgi:DNA-binding NtrC family response regulator